jgi:ATP synthase protein I
MIDKKSPPSLDELDTKLNAVAAKRNNRGARSKERGAGLGFAVKIGVDIVAAVIVGVGVGLLLDNWLGTKPWMLIVFFVLGAAAGMLNVFRAVSGYGYAAGYQHRARKEGTDNGEGNG